MLSVRFDHIRAFLGKTRYPSYDRAGFTLIELLVVIGVLGILSAGILAAIDPLEQLRKGRDTQKRNIAVELNNAIVRYQAIQGVFPWYTTTDNNRRHHLATAAVRSDIQDLIGVGELKPQFLDGLPNNVASVIWVIYNQNVGDVYVCFNPESKAISSDPSTIFAGGANGNSTTNPPTVNSSACPNPDNNCLWCAR